MPAKYDLTWDAEGRRWRKFSKGKRYVISCQQLGGPPTKEGSYRAANEWWSRKQAEIDQSCDAIKPYRHLYEQAIANRKDMVAWMQQEGVVDDQSNLHARLLQEVRQLETDWAKDPPPPLDTTVDGHLSRPIPVSGDDPQDNDWWERIQSIRNHRRWVRPPKEDETIAARVDLDLACRRTEAESGQSKATSYLAIQDRLPHLKTDCGDQDAAKIDDRTLSAAKAFCRAMWRDRVLERLPRNPPQGVTKRRYAKPSLC